MRRLRRYQGSRHFHPSTNKLPHSNNLTVEHEELDEVTVRVFELRIENKIRTLHSNGSGKLDIEVMLSLIGLRGFSVVRRPEELTVLQGSLDTENCREPLRMRTRTGLCRADCTNEDQNCSNTESYGNFHPD